MSLCVCPYWHEFDLIHFHLYLSVSHEAPPRPEAPGLSHLRTWKVLAYWWTFLPSQVTKTQRKKAPTEEHEESMSKGRGSDEEITRDHLIETERMNEWRRRTNDKRPWWCFPAGSWVVHMELEIWDTCSLSSLRFYQIISYSVVLL